MKEHFARNSFVEALTSSTSTVSVSGETALKEMIKLK